MTTNRLTGTHADLVIIAVLTAIALGTRMYGLSQWPATGDELATIQHAANRYDSIVNPAYYTLVLLSFNFFGVSELAARLPATLLAVLSVPLFFVTWRNIIGRNAALVGALLIIFSSWHLFYSQYSRFYSGVFLFGSLSYYLFYQSLRHDDLGRLAGALVAALAGFLFHVTVVMVPAACAAYSLLVVLKGDTAQGGLSLRVAKIYLAICGLGALVAMGVLWDIWLGRQSHGVSWGDRPGEMVLQTVRLVQLPIGVTATFGVLILLQRNAWAGVYFLVGTLFPVAFVLTGSVFLNSRAVYLFYALPLFIALAGLMCEEVRRALVAQNRLAAHVLTAVLLLTLTPEMLSYYTGKRSLDVRNVVAYIAASRRPGDVVLSLNREFEYYARGKFPVTLVATSVYGRRNLLEKITTAVGDHGRVWVILATNRKPLPKDFENWLTKNSRLRWRRFEKRFDYPAKGYEIFLVDRTSDRCSDL
jgi:hypothetical protein